MANQKQYNLLNIRASFAWKDKDGWKTGHDSQIYLYQPTQEQIQMAIDTEMKKLLCATTYTKPGEVDRMVAMSAYYPEHNQGILMPYGDTVAMYDTPFDPGGITWWPANIEKDKIILVIEDGNAQVAYTTSPNVELIIADIDNYRAGDAYSGPFPANVVGENEFKIRAAGPPPLATFKEYRPDVPDTAESPDPNAPPIIHLQVNAGGVSRVMATVPATVYITDHDEDGKAHPCEVDLWTPAQLREYLKAPRYIAENE